MSQHNNINDLFCTPEQGRRLKELVPELKFNMIWVFVRHEQRWAKFPLFVERFKNRYKRWYDKQKDMDELVHDSIRYKSASPALTLQELFPLFKYSIYTERAEVIVYGLMHGTLTAPELAAWVIERLEG